MIRAFQASYDPCAGWYWDKSVWQKMLRTLTGCGLDHVILSGPTPAEIDGPAAEMLGWILDTALDYEAAPYVALNAPDPDATRSAIRSLVSDYPDTAGVYLRPPNPSVEIATAAAETLDAVRPDAKLVIEVTDGGLAEKGPIARHGGRPVMYCHRYTGDHLVNENPDPSFARIVESAGARSVIASFGFANFEPWSCFSYETVGSVLDNLADAGCAGFVIDPICPEQWPRVSDTYFKFQWQRDLVWYHVWGGSSVDRLVRQGQPKWLVRNSRLVQGFDAGSRIIELITLYFGGARDSSFRPQYCTIADPAPRLVTLEDMLCAGDNTRFAARDWWTEVTGDRVVHLAEFLRSGTAEDAYGPDELIEELTDLSEQAAASGEKGMRSSSGEKELPGFARDAFCMSRLGEFYVERIKAALAHARGEDSEALEHANRALGLYREIRGVDQSHRALPSTWTWLNTIGLLEAEIETLSRRP